MKIVFDESFDWLAVLKDLAAGAPLSITNHETLVARAHCWPTCACGQLCQALPRNRDGVPLDHELEMAGLSFATAVRIEDWTWAISTFHDIEARTQKLLLSPEAVSSPRTSYLQIEKP